MSREGTLGSEVQRRSAEIGSWPAWAQPYAPEPPTTPSGSPPAPAPEQPQQSAREGDGGRREA